MKRLAALLVAALLAMLAAFAAAEAGDGRMRAYGDVLRLYRQAQDGGYTMEQVEDMGLYTGLVQHGWPAAALNDEVRYLYFDADSDGSDELIITYCGDIVDLYDYDGQRARHVHMGTVLLCSWQIVSPVFVNTKGPSPCVPSTASTEATGGIDLERAIGYV